MPRCPYCEGEVSETAAKCKHCGEWLKRPEDRQRAQQSAWEDADDSLGSAAHRYVSFRMVMGGIGIILFLIVFFTVFLPMSCSVNRGFNSGPDWVKPAPGGPVIPAN